MFAGVTRSREAVETLADEIAIARAELEYHEKEAEARRALLVELEAACEALRRGAENASRRRRVLDRVQVKRLGP